MCVFSLSNSMSMLDPFIPYLIEVTAVNEIADITSEISEVTVFTQQGRKYYTYTHTYTHQDFLTMADGTFPV